MYYDYQHKLILSGNIAEVYTYEGSFFRRNFGVLRKPRPKDDLEDIVDRTQEYMSRGAHRARSMIKRLIYANFDKPGTTFLTLTFDDDRVPFDTTDILASDLYFSAFRKRLARLIPTVRWVCVPEYQKRGAVHYHMVTDAEIKPIKKNNFRKKDNIFYDARINGDLLSDVWDGGFIGVQPISGEIIQTSQYISKYLRKGRHDVIGRSYRTTTNLTRPTVLYSNRGSDLSSYGLLGGSPLFTSNYVDKGGSNIKYDVYQLLRS